MAFEIRVRQPISSGSRRGGGHRSGRLIELIGRPSVTHTTKLTVWFWYCAGDLPAAASGEVDSHQHLPVGIGGVSTWAGGVSPSSRVPETASAGIGSAFTL